MSATLKAIIQDLVNERHDQAKVSIHQYFLEKTKSLTEAGILYQYITSLAGTPEESKWEGSQDTDDIIAFAESEAKKYSVTVEVTEREPNHSGGWPHFKFVGTKGALTNMIDTIYLGEFGFSKEDDEYTQEIEGIEPFEKTKVKEAVEKGLSSGERKKKDFDFQRMMAGAMSRDEFNKKWKLGKYAPPKRNHIDDMNDEYAARTAKMKKEGLDEDIKHDEKEFVIVKDEGKDFDKGQKIDMEWFTNKDTAPYYIHNAPDRRTLKAMKVGDEQTFDEDGYWGPVTIKRTK